MKARDKRKKVIKRAKKSAVKRAPVTPPPAAPEAPPPDAPLTHHLKPDGTIVELTEDEKKKAAEPTIAPAVPVGTPPRLDGDGTPPA